MTFNQGRIFAGYKKGKNLLIHGTAGTGKTFSAMYLALKDVMHGVYGQILIIRSVVPSRDVGFLPGSIKEKSRIYETPYYGIFSEILDHENGYEVAKQKGWVDFTTTSHLRGLTVDNSIIIVDECQNMNWQELNTILTRIGNNSKVILCGDTKQSDLDDKKGRSDILKIVEVCKAMDSFETVVMLPQDIVRSSFVKEYIMACEELGY